ncbi:MAG: Ig-like domain-containing protein [Bacteroidales bacterium]|nr:Ig-like domain-containing protein [Bacteroidales bacterium]
MKNFNFLHGLLVCIVLQMVSLMGNAQYEPNGDVFEIWNWDDLAHTMDVHNAYPAVTTFKLMQHLGIPGQAGTYGDGSEMSLAVQPSHPGDKRFGWYGYEGFIGIDQSTPYDQYDGSDSEAEYGGTWTPDPNCGWHVTEGWIPIGTQSVSFRRIFDGNGKAITGLWINSVNNYQGLFGYVSSGSSINVALIKDLGINTGVSGIIGNAYCGGVAGSAEYTTIINCYVTGNIEGQGANVGGVVGYAARMTISSCYTTCAVMGNTLIGGIIGQAYLDVNISDSYATGAVTGSQQVGGVAGSVKGSTMTRCYAANVVETTSEFVGGLVGEGMLQSVGPFQTNSHIEQCFALNPEIIAPVLTNNIGRVVGIQYGGCILNDNFGRQTMIVKNAMFSGSTGSSDRNGDDITDCEVVNACLDVFKTKGGWNDFDTDWTFVYSDYTIAEGTNLPILKPFTIAYFDNAVQPPSVDKCIPKYEITLTSDSGTDNQEVCINQAITDITYFTVGVVDESEVDISGLPEGVEGSWENDVITISGAPTTAIGSPFNYTITLGGECSDVTAKETVTVNALPIVSIDGNDVICVGATTDLLPDSGGTWTSSNDLVATVTNAGVVTGVSGGTATFTFTNTATGCSATTGTLTVNVSIVSITGSTSICVGKTTTLSPSSGGTWTSSDDLIATVTNVGVVTGVSGGTVTFTFTNTTTGCSATTETVTVITTCGEAVLGVEIANCPEDGILPTTDFLQLEAQVFPEDATNKELVWHSSNSSIAFVDQTGYVTPGSTGVAIITVTTMEGGFTATCPIRVIQPITEVKLNKNTMALMVGGDETLIATVLPENADIKTVTWSSDATAIATVDGNGKVTAMSVGTAIITATTVVGGLTATCAVTVTGAFIMPTGVTVTPKTLTLAKDATASLTTEVKPVGANPAITWTTNNVAIATVDASGIVTGVAVGKAVITAKTVNNYSATCTVTVTAGKIGDAPPSSPEGEDVRVYPNPTSGLLTIACYRHCGLDPQSSENDEIAGQARNDIRGVEIFDVLGRTYNVSRVTRNEMDISFLPPGVYFIRIQTETGAVTKKIIKSDPSR